MGLACGSGAAEPPPAAAANVGDEIVQMSPYEVIARTATFNKWRKVASPHFVIYTDGDAAEARQILREMEMLHLTAQYFLRRQPLRRQPMMLVLPTSSSDWRKLEAKGGVEWRVAVSAPAHYVADLVLAEYDWEADDASSIVAPFEGRAKMFGATVAAELQWLGLEGQMWFERGIHDFFESAEFTGDTVTLGRPSIRVLELRDRSWLAWDRFFQVNGDSPEFTREAEIHRYEGQCAIFAQFMLANSDPAWLDRFMMWNALLEAGHEPTEAQFRSIFGQDWKTWQRTMEKHLAGGKYQVSHISFPADALNFEIRPVKLGPTEMRELFVLCQILNQKVPASDASLDALLRHGLKSEGLHDVLVEACLARGRPGPALVELKKAISGGSTNAAVYALAGQLELRSVIRQPSVDAALSDSAAREIADWCRRGLEIEPLEPRANETLAWAEAYAPNVGAQAITTIEQCYRAVSGRGATGNIVAAMAVAYHRSGDKRRAGVVAGALFNSPYADPDSQRLAAAILAGTTPAPLVSPNRRERK